VVQEMQERPRIVSSELDLACYDQETDTVHLPIPETFELEEGFYSVAFHELVHSTCHPIRLGRRSDKIAPFGSPEYSQEELTAELGATYLCSYCGIENLTIRNSAAYVKGWLARLAGKPQLFSVAAAHAERAANFILNEPKATDPS
jgi:antirestriction protein ArdC